MVPVVTLLKTRNGFGAATRFMEAWAPSRGEVDMVPAVTLLKARLGFRAGLRFPNLNGKLTMVGFPRLPTEVNRSAK